MRVNALAIAHMIRALQQSPMSRLQLAEVSGLHYSTVGEYMRALHKVGAVHIAGLDKDGRGANSIEIYRLGPGTDAVRQVLTDAQKKARYRARQKWSVPTTLHAIY